MVYALRDISSATSNKWKRAPKIDLLTPVGVKEERELRRDSTGGLAKDGNQIYSGILYCCVLLGLEQWRRWMISGIKVVC